MSSKADPDVYLIPAVKSNGFKYYEYLLCYVDDVLCISDNTTATMQGIQRKFKVKDDKIEPPQIYLGAGLTKMTNDTNKECWDMASNSYCKAAVTNVKEALKKKGLRLPS